MQLAQRLVKKGVLSAQDLPRLAEEHAAAPNKPLHQLLVEKGFAKEEDVLPVLAEPREIARLIKTHFGGGGDTVAALAQEREDEAIELLEGLEADDSEAA